MKSRLIMVGLIVILALCLLACSSETAEEPPAPSQPSAPSEPAEPIDPSTYAAKTTVEFYTCNRFASQPHITDEIKLTVGKGVTLMLCSNQSTGFQWVEEAQISDPGVVAQIGHEYTAPVGDKPGAAGTEKFIFAGLKSGTSTVSMEYGQPWEGGEKAAWTCVLTVVVK